MPAKFAVSSGLLSISFHRDDEPRDLGFEDDAKDEVERTDTLSRPLQEEPDRREEPDEKTVPSEPSEEREDGLS